MFIKEKKKKKKKKKNQWALAFNELRAHARRSSKHAPHISNDLFFVFTDWCKRDNNSTAGCVKTRPG
jgi:hypothetical protein